MREEKLEEIRKQIKKLKNARKKYIGRKKRMEKLSSDPKVQEYIRLQQQQENTDKFTYYMLSYHLTDEGKKAYDSHEHEYSGSIDVSIQVKDETVVCISIGFGKPRWMGYLEKNGYHREEWEYHF